MKTTRIDAYTNHIFEQIPQDVKDTFSEIQTEAIKEAVKSGFSPKRHAIDLRGVIPLFFWKFYFVFHFGRDTRSTTKDTELGRRTGAKLLGNILFIIAALSPIVLILMIILYFLKSAMGINLFPNLSLSDILTGIGNWIEGLLF